MNEEQRKRLLDDVRRYQERRKESRNRSASTINAALVEATKGEASCGQSARRASCLQSRKEAYREAVRKYDHMAIECMTYDAIAPKDFSPREKFDRLAALMADMGISEAYDDMRVKSIALTDLTAIIYPEFGEMFKARMAEATLLGMRGIARRALTEKALTLE